MRLTAPAIVLAGLFFAACTGTKSNTTDGGTDGGGACQSARDCAASDPSQCASPKVCVCSNEMCVPVCQTNSDCATPQICVEGSCSNPGCGGNADCTSGQVCIGGNCESPTAASQLHSCVIAPLSADVHQGSTVQLSVVAQDSSGNALPFTGASWSVPAATTWATVDQTGLVTGGAATAGASQPAVISATLSPGITCTATVNVYGNVTAANTLRVVVIDEDTKLPVSGAYVVLDSNTAAPVTSAADGSAVFTLAAGSGAHNVHAFAANYDYSSFIGVTGTDLIIPIRQFYPIAQRAPFDGSISLTDFSTLTELNEVAHIGFFGSSVSGSLLDFTLDDFIGQTRDVTISLTGSPIVLPGAPGGLVLGLASDLYTGDVDGGSGAQSSTYSMYADPGRRVLWGIGGNLDVATILTVAGPIISGGTSNINIGTLLPEVLPLLGDLEFGDVVGVEANASVAAGGTPTAINQSVTLDTPMHMNVAVKAPNLPQFNGTYVDGVIALTGAAAFPLGFTPLGVTAGLAATDTSMNKTGAILNPNCTASATVNCATNILPMQVAARNHGLESYPYGVVLVALNFGALTSGGNGTIAVSGKVQNEDTITFSGGSAAPTQIDMSTTGFMKLPGSTNSVSYGTAARTIAITADADSTTQIYKFTLQATSHQTWSVYMAPAGASGSQAVLINPTDVNASLTDLTAGTGSTGWISAIATDGASNTFSTLTGGGNVTVDALGNHLAAFAVQTVALGQ